MKEAPSVSREEFRSWSDYIVKRATHRHEIDAIGLIGRYEFDEPCECSYFGHRHKKGLLIETRCSDVLAIGLTCGEREIAGFKRIMGQIGAATHFQAILAAQAEGEHRTILESVATLAAHCRKRLAGRDALARIPRVHTAAREAATISNRRNVQIRVPERDLKDRIVGWKHETRRLEAVDQLFIGLSSNLVEAIVADAESYAEKVSRTEITLENFVEISTERKKLREQEARLRIWLDGSAKFWTPENLRLVLIAAFGDQDRVPDEISVEGRTIVVAGPPRIAIGIEGVE